MHAATGSMVFGKLEFGRGVLMRPARTRRPLAEKILFWCPRLASALAAAGAREARRGSIEAGTLASMMAVSGSIDRAGRARNYYRFYIRPMA